MSSSRFQAPAGRPANGEWTIRLLQQHLEAAVLVEATTIPVYLYAYYAFKNPADPKLTGFNRVVREEMLHLTLVGNMLRAIGGAPKLYGSDYIPTFPTVTLYDSIYLDLRRPKARQVQKFVDFEAPADSEPVETTPARGRTVMPEYHTVAEFYDALQEGLTEMHEKIGDKLFGFPQFQFQTKDPEAPVQSAFGYVIDSLEKAKKAIKTIIDQGEGGPPGTEKAPDSHYVFFKTLHAELSNPATTTVHSYDVLDSPVTENFKTTDPELYNVMLASDAAYCYLMLSLENMWLYEDQPESLGYPTRRNLSDSWMPIMRIAIPEYAKFLVTQKLESGKHAAAPFNFYKFTTGSPLDELITLAETAAGPYKNEPNHPTERVLASLKGLYHIRPIFEGRVSVPVK